MPARKKSSAASEREKLMPRLHVSGICKRFGPTEALRDFSLTIEPGEVHALVGENGAGKSTLVAIVSGAEKPDAGRMEIEGVPYRPEGPLAARRAGLAVVHQELALAPHLCVEDNIMLGVERHRFGLLKHKEQRTIVSHALDFLEHPELQPETIVGRLTSGARQLVEIARALANASRLVILDEPTSSLPLHDAERLFAILDRLKKSGVAVIFISHFLEEIRRVADRYTVLRNGKNVATGQVASTPVSVIVEQMIGRTVGELYPRAPHEMGEEVLQVQGLASPLSAGAVNLTLRRGEVFGLFGLVGAGRTEFLRQLFGLDPVRVNSLQWKQAALKSIDVHKRLQAGMGLLSEDRKHEGLSLQQSLEENLTLSRLQPYLHNGILSWKQRRKATQTWLERFNVTHRKTIQVASQLSGGNQQKLALARLFHQNAELLLLDEPTKGVDIGSKQEIYRSVSQAAAAGKTLIIVSSYLPELLGICDTLAVMARGQMSAKRPVDQWRPQEIMTLATASQDRNLN
jgi:ribose transport system ATP-binding protein